MTRTASIFLIDIIHNILSLLTLPSCRFSPSCSSYAKQAIRQHGSVKGWWLALKRLARCHPLGPAGLDPIPKP